MTMPSLRRTIGPAANSVVAPIASFLTGKGSEAAVPVQPPALPASPRLHPWHEAFSYAKSSGLSRASAQDFADHYAAYIEDRTNEIRYPDLPLPTPSEFIP